jgi:hypothetical protein
MTGERLDIARLRAVIWRLALVAGLVGGWAGAAAFYLALRWIAP